MIFTLKFLERLLGFWLAVTFLFMHPAGGSTGRKKETLEDLSRDAYVWAYPAVLMKQAREAMLAATKNPGEAVNHFFHSDRMPNLFLKDLVPVNTENIYSWAWLDLSREPVVFVQPEIKNRYYATHFVDAFSNVFEVLSNKTQQEKSGVFVLTPPDWSGVLPAGTTQIKAATPDVFVLVQAFVKEPKEGPRVLNIMKQYHLVTLSDWIQGIQKEKTPETSPVASLSFRKNLAAQGLTFFDELQQVLARNPVPGKSDGPELERLGQLDFKGKNGFSKNLSDPDMVGMIERGLFNGEQDLENRLSRGFGTKVNGWSYEMKLIPFDDDFLARAAVAKNSFFALAPEEIMQLSVDTDSEARQLNSAYRYLLHFDKEDFPSARSGWSLRVYDARSNTLAAVGGRPNSLSDHQRNLQFNRDGSMDLLIQRESPSKNQEGNWLALSKNSNFYVVMTVYNPGNLVLNRKYIAPSLTRIDEDHLPKVRIVQKMMARDDRLGMRRLAAAKGHP
jgi:hypothetical protein